MVLEPVLSRLYSEDVYGRNGLSNEARIVVPQSIAIVAAVRDYSSGGLPAGSQTVNCRYAS